MNREIKFRAWDKNKNVFIPADTFAIINNDHNALAVMIKDWEDYREGEFMYEHAQSVDQYTGLKDKNGVEIYEGDILRNPAKDEWGKINYTSYEVFFHDGDANTDYNIGFSINRTCNHGSVCGGCIPSFKPKQVSTMEVIGNIHANPELLP